MHKTINPQILTVRMPADLDREEEKVQDELNDAEEQIYRTG